MAESYVQTSADGTTTIYNFSFDYLDASHVTVLVDGVDTSFTWLNTYSVSVAPAPPSGSQVRVRRVTPRASPVVDYTDGSVLVESDLDTTSIQMLYIAQEAFDAAAETLQKTVLDTFDAGGLRVTNLGAAVDPDDAVSTQYIEDNYSAPFATAQAALTATVANTTAVNDAKTATEALQAATQVLHDTVVTLSADVATDADMVETWHDAVVSLHAAVVSLKAATDTNAALTAADVTSTAADAVQTAADRAGLR